MSSLVCLLSVFLSVCYTCGQRGRRRNEQQKNKLDGSIPGSYTIRYIDVLRPLEITQYGTSSICSGYLVFLAVTGNRVTTIIFCVKALEIWLTEMSQ